MAPLLLLDELHAHLLLLLLPVVIETQEIALQDEIARGTTAEVPVTMTTIEDPVAMMSARVLGMMRNEEGAAGETTVIDGGKVTRTIGREGTRRTAIGTIEGDGKNETDTGTVREIEVGIRANSVRFYDFCSFSVFCLTIQW